MNINTEETPQILTLSTSTQKICSSYFAYNHFHFSIQISKYLAISSFHPTFFTQTKIYIYIYATFISNFSRMTMTGRNKKEKCTRARIKYDLTEGHKWYIIDLPFAMILVTESVESKLIFTKRRHQFVVFLSDTTIPIEIPCCRVQI